MTQNRSDIERNYTTHIPLHKNTALSLYIDFIPIKFTAYFFQVQSSHPLHLFKDNITVCKKYYQLSFYIWFPQFKYSGSNTQPV